MRSVSFVKVISSIEHKNAPKNDLALQVLRTILVRLNHAKAKLYTVNSRYLDFGYLE